MTYNYGVSIFTYDANGKPQPCTFDYKFTTKKEAMKDYEEAVKWFDYVNDIPGFPPMYQHGVALYDHRHVEPKIILIHDYNDILRRKRKLDYPNANFSSAYMNGQNPS